MLVSKIIRRRRIGRESWRTMMGKAHEPDVCPNASKRQFMEDRTRYCLIGGTCASFRLKPFKDRPRWQEPGDETTLENYCSTVSG